MVRIANPLAARVLRGNVSECGTTILRGVWSAAYNDRVIPSKDTQLYKLLKEIPPRADVPG